MLRSALCIFMFCAIAAAQENAPRIESRDLSDPGTPAATPSQQEEFDSVVVDAQPISEASPPPPQTQEPTQPDPVPQDTAPAQRSTATTRSNNSVAAFWFMLPGR